MRIGIHDMQQIKTFLNEQEYRMFKDKAQNMNLSEYALLKLLVQNFLHKENLPETDILHEQIRQLNKRQKHIILYLYLLLCYALAATCIILFF